MAHWFQAWPTPQFLRNEPELHFHIALQADDPQRQRDLIDNVQRPECTLTITDGETIEGYLEYNPGFSNDREPTARLHKLLSPWRRKGHLAWSATRKK